MKSESLPVVALVGEPNVGKSTLLNKIEGKRRAVTSDIAGTTRDRQYAEVEWSGVPFLLLDTAGIVDKTDTSRPGKGRPLTTNNELEINIYQQIDFAIKEADILVWVVDGKNESNTVPQKVISVIRKTRKPTLLAINKTDAIKKIQENLGRFSRLGVKHAFAVSSVTGNGLGDLLDCVVEKINKLPKKETRRSESSVAVSIIGKPNVGKSSLFNKILGQDRVVVSAVPGTTRSSIDSELKIAGKNYTFIDTAGLKRRTHTQATPDIFSGFQTYKSIRRSDVVILVFESTEELTSQDIRLAGLVLEMEKGLILAVNKMDKYVGSEEKLQNYFSVKLPFLWMSPVFFISAKTGQGIGEMIKAIQPIAEARGNTIPENELKDLLAKLLKKSPPRKMLEQKDPKVYGLTQIGINPPTFELFVNHPAAISRTFRNTVINAIIRELGFWGTPVLLKLKGKDKK